MPQTTDSYLYTHNRIKRIPLSNKITQRRKDNIETNNKMSEQQSNQIKRMKPANMTDAEYIAEYKRGFAERMNMSIISSEKGFPLKSEHRECIAQIRKKYNLQ